MGHLWRQRWFLWLILLGVPHTWQHRLYTPQGAEMVQGKKWMAHWPRVIMYGRHKHHCMTNSKIIIWEASHPCFYSHLWFWIGKDATTLSSRRHARALLAASHIDSCDHGVQPKIEQNPPGIGENQRTTLLTYDLSRESNQGNIGERRSPVHTQAKPCHFSTIHAAIIIIIINLQFSIVPFRPMFTFHLFNY